jgi:exonuclease III
MKICTYNVNGLGSAIPVLEELQLQAADCICLQEVLHPRRKGHNSPTTESREIDVLTGPPQIAGAKLAELDRLAQGLGMHYSYAACQGNMGNAILSRQPHRCGSHVMPITFF